MDSGFASTQSRSPGWHQPDRRGAVRKRGLLDRRSAISAPAGPLTGRDNLEQHAADDRSEWDATAAAVRFFLLAAVRPATHSSRSLSAAGRQRTSRSDADSLDLPCRHDPDLWFAEAPADLERAKVLCATCPIRLACLAVAVDRAEFAGVWGGHIFDRGRIVPRKRSRGRPRKRHDPQAASEVLPLPTPESDVTSDATAQRAAHRVHAAAARLYDAECALHVAHQSHVDGWIDAASQKLHDAVAEYLSAAAARESPVAP